MKTCTKCKEPKALDDFYKEKKNLIDGRASYCKVCRDAQKDAYNKTDKGIESLRKASKTYRSSEKGRANNRARMTVINATPESKISKREWHLIKRYNLTLEQWNALFKEQGCKCASCPRTDPGWNRGWHTDHDHATGKVCAILCHSCNTALGLLDDDPERILMLHQYALRTREVA